MSDPKAAARRAAHQRRKTAKATVDEMAVLAHLAEALEPFSGQVLAGYMAIRSEVDPLPVMAGWRGQACVPVIVSTGQPLEFHRWSPDAEMVAGAFGAAIPANAVPVVPDVIIVPLLAFDRSGGRLGYGGGFYDRTLEILRARRPVTALGLAFAAQETEGLPLEPTDQPLDGVVTEDGMLLF